MGKLSFLVLMVDDILLATNDLQLLHEVKQFIFKKFDMKDVVDTLMSLALRSIGIDLKLSWDYLKKPMSI